MARIRLLNRIAGLVSASKIPASGPDATISADEMRVLSATDSDCSGKLFSWQGELYRGIYPSRAAFCRRLIESGLVERLAAQGLLVPTEPTGLRALGFDLILRHQRVPFVTYPFEWSPLMLRDAALQILAFQSELTRHNLTLQDGHCWNVLFQHTQPLFVDFGSIVENPSTGVWPSWEEFCRHCLYPLALASRGETRLMHVLLRDFLNGVPEVVAAGVCPELKQYRAHRAALSPDTDLPGRLAFLDALRRDVESVPLPRRATEWSEYYGDTLGSLDHDPGWRLKQRTFWEVLTRLKPRTVLDVASNRGLYAQMAAKAGCQVAAFDIDDTVVSDMYGDAKKLRLPLTPLVMDLLDPSPPLGLSHAWFPGACERLRAEFVLGSALVHHGVFRMRLSLRQIAETLRRLTERWLLVEFIPREDRYVKEWWKEEYGWYTQANFAMELRRHFARIDVLPSDPEPRAFLLCQL